MTSRLCPAVATNAQPSLTTVLYLASSCTLYSKDCKEQFQITPAAFIFHPTSQVYCSVFIYTWFRMFPTCAICSFVFFFFWWITIVSTYGIYSDGILFYFCCYNWIPRVRNLKGIKSCLSHGSEVQKAQDWVDASGKVLLAGGDS